MANAPLSAPKAVTLDAVINWVRAVYALHRWKWAGKDGPPTVAECRNVTNQLIADTLTQAPMAMKERLLVYRTGDDAHGQITVAIELATFPLDVAKELAANALRNAGNGTIKSNRRATTRGS